MTKQKLRELLHYYKENQYKQDEVKKKIKFEVTCVGWMSLWKNQMLKIYDTYSLCS